MTGFLTHRGMIIEARSWRLEARRVRGINICEHLRKTSANICEKQNSNTLKNST